MPRWSLLALLGIALLAPTPAAAQVGDVQIAWNECVAKGGLEDLDFACVGDDQLSRLVVSFHQDLGVGLSINMMRLTLGIRTSLPCDGPGPCRGIDLPDWWRFDAAGCRRGSFTTSADFTQPPFDAGTGCANLWAPHVAAAGQASVTYPVPDSYWGTFYDRETILTEVDLFAAPVTAQSGVNYYAMHLDIDHALTSGGAICDGCCRFMVLTPILLEVGTDQPPGLLHLTPSGLVGGAVTWQAGAPGVPPGCSISATGRATWGALKGLYR